MNTEISERVLTEQIKGKSIEVIHIGLSDQTTLKKIPHARGMHDYESGGIEVLPPPNLLRGLLKLSSIDRLRATGEALSNQGIKNLGIFIAKHSFSYATNRNRYMDIDKSVPGEVGVSYTYEDPEGERTRLYLTSIKMQGEFGNYRLIFS